MDQRYTYDTRGSTAGLANWRELLSDVLTSQATVAENSTARLRGVGQWIWPVALAVVALGLGYLILRKKGR